MMQIKKFDRLQEINLWLCENPNVPVRVLVREDGYYALYTARPIEYNKRVRQ